MTPPVQVRWRLRRSSSVDSSRERMFGEYHLTIWKMRFDSTTAEELGGVAHNYH